MSVTEDRPVIDHYKVLAYDSFGHTIITYRGGNLQDAEEMYDRAVGQLGTKYREVELVDILERHRHEG